LQRELEQLKIETGYRFQIRGWSSERCRIIFRIRKTRFYSGGYRL